MPVEVSVKTVEPTPTAVVVDNIMLYKDDAPNVEVGVQVSGTFEPAGQVVANWIPLGDLRRPRPGDRRLRCGCVLDVDAFIEIVSV